jgi:hypothetical protein
MTRFPFFMSTSEERETLFGTGQGKAIAPTARQAHRLALVNEDA